MESCEDTGFIAALGKLIWHVLPAIVAVVFGGLVVNRFFVRKANQGLLVDRICNRLDSLAADCAEYWSDGAKGLANKRVPLESKIKGNGKHIASLVKVAGIKYGHTEDRKSRTKFLVMNLYDACTGGEFESSKREIDRRQFAKIVTAVNELSSELLLWKL